MKGRILNGRMNQLAKASVLLVVIMMLPSCFPPNPYMEQYFGKQSTGTYLKLTVRFAGSNNLVSGALVQVSGKNNNVFRQGTTGSNGTVTLTNLEPGTYVVRAWKGNKASEDTIYISGPVTALMRIG